MSRDFYEEYITALNDRDKAQARLSAIYEELNLEHTGIYYEELEKLNPLRDLLKQYPERFEEAIDLYRDFIWNGAYAAGLYVGCEIGKWTWEHDIV